MCRLQRAGCGQSYLPGIAQGIEGRRVCRQVGGQPLQDLWAIPKNVLTYLYNLFH